MEDNDSRSSAQDSSGKGSNADRTTRAVALEWDRRKAPRITAAGSGLTADAILKIAEEHGIPLHQDPGLSEALAQIPLGSEIPEELYVAVAEILAFVFLLAGITPDDREDGYRGPGPRS
ncbi:EscU/YscU/HrcU family type III secretion system export apparatus switch protein [Thioalkalivibrio sp. ALJ7]|uniref:EscU/YscU/HrcU family type III secretion system export apparatus switch protein n=1 Tax=Thioalkalivibrio sp. ALJ7 TaxID=1158756 RepID=UPI00035D32C4|nr:EscU/YscU/HrcU family type III secretion system export apparatus switch protein [Thioalkalivibrio sp. ALJ7]